MMAKYFWLALFFAFSAVVSAQNIAIRISEIPDTACEQYFPLKNGYKPHEISMAFNSNVVEDSVLSKDINLNEIVQIDLVYTSFREVESFNQKQLNYNRWMTLQKIVPEVFYLPHCTYQNVAQRGAKEVDTAKHYFHGFYIYTKTKTYKSSRVKKDFDMIDASLKEAENAATVRDSVCITDRWIIKKRYEKTGYYLPASPEKRAKGFKSSTYTKKYPFEEKIAYSDSTLQKDSFNCSEIKFISPPVNKLPDTAILKILQRNPQWSKKLMVVDVTASMAPYSLQVLYYLKALNNKAGMEKFVFFNDGDGIDDSKKTIGNVGGIYIIGSNMPFDSIYRTFKRAMINGDGGDLQENDIEAIEKGIDNCKTCKDVILIGDNIAPVRDMNILRRIGRPIHVIICGNTRKINPDLFRIAEETKGSIHTLHTDADFSKGFENGDVIRIGQYQFKYYNNRFIASKIE